ncbi:hypothetical protein D3C87_94850 [compost metagenome]
MLLNKFQFVDAVFKAIEVNWFLKPLKLSFFELFQSVKAPKLFPGYRIAEIDRENNLVILAQKDIGKVLVTHHHPLQCDVFFVVTDIEPDFYVIFLDKALFKEIKRIDGVIKIKKCVQAISQALLRSFCTTLIRFLP